MRENIFNNSPGSIRRSMPKILIKTGDKKGEILTLTDRAVFVGRDPSNTIILPDRRVSRKHASISPRGPEWLIEDLGSANGTRVNNQPVHRRVLRPGDEISLGGTVLQFAPFLEGEEAYEDSQELAIPAQPADDRDPTYESTIAIAIPPQEVDALVFPPDEAELSNLQKAYLRLAIMYRLINDLVTVTDLKELMDRTAEQVLKIIRADRALMMLVDDQSGELVPQATRQRKGLPHSDAVGFSTTISRRVFETGESILTSDAMEDDRFEESESVILNRIRSSLCVPIKTKDRTLGIIHVDTLRIGAGFSQEDLELLGAMGHQIGIAVENAKLVTQLKKANIELKEQQDQLIDAERLTLLGKIAAGVAHEINNPIMSILGFTGMASSRLKEGVSSPGKREECLHYLEVAQEEAQRCIQIVENISQFYSRKQSDLAPTDINTVVEAALNVAKFQLNKGRIKAVRDLNPRLPRVMANRGLLQQVFLNIILNASDAMKPGGTLTVSTATESPPWTAIRISDTGSGIEPDDIKKVFLPSFSTKGEGKGTGLGLSISQDIIKSHKGTIDVKSVVGKGTTFIVRLPTINP
jgi:signal transduction histidine kinase